MPNLLFNIIGEDHLSPVLHHAKKETKELKESMEGVTESMKSLLTMFGIAGAGFEVAELVKDSIKEYRSLIQEQTKIQSLLRNAPHDIKLGFDQIREASEQISKNLAIPLDQVERTAAGLLKIPKIAGDREIFEKAMPLSYDLAAANIGGGTAEGAAKQIERLMMNPAMASRLLVQAGVGDENTRKALQNAVKLHKTTEAQIDIMNILTQKYGGLAEELAKKDPFYQFNKSMMNLRETLGPLATQFATKLVPIISEWVDKMTAWLEALKPEDVEDAVNKVVTVFELLGGVVGGFIDVLKPVISLLGSVVPGSGDGSDKSNAATAGSLIFDAWALNKGYKFVKGLGKGGEGAEATEGAGIAGEATEGITLLGAAATKAAGVLSMLSLFFSKGDNNDVHQVVRGGVTMNISDAEWRMEQRDQEKQQSSQWASLSPTQQSAINNQVLSSLGLFGTNPLFTQFPYAPGKGPKAKKEKDPFAEFADFEKKMLNSVNTVHGVKPTNIYLNFNGGQGNFRIEGGINNMGDLDEIKDKLITTIEQAIAEGINEGQLMGTNR